MSADRDAEDRGDDDEIGEMRPRVSSILSVSRARVSAANSTMAPWAKLNTPDALKISTKPSATSE